jgi:hypothetical protein
MGADIVMESISLIEAEKAKGRRILALWPGATFKEHLKKV